MNFFHHKGLGNHLLQLCLKVVKHPVEMKINWTFVNGCGCLLLQSALQPLWVLACSTIVDYSQQEGFYRVPLPAARQNPNLEDQWLERCKSRHQVSPTPETTRANPSSGRWNYGRDIRREFCRKWRLPRYFWVLLHAVNLRHGNGWGCSLFY